MFPVQNTPLKINEMKKILPIILFLTCFPSAAQEGIPNNVSPSAGQFFNDMREEIRDVFTGLPALTLLSYLGLPAQESTVLGLRIVSWESILPFAETYKPCKLSVAFSTFNGISTAVRIEVEGLLDSCTMFQHSATTARKELQNDEKYKKRKSIAKEAEKLITVR